MVLQMCMQNIIDRISIWDASSNIADYGDKLYSLFTGKLPDSIDMSLPSIKSAIVSIQSGELSLVEIEPVYGAIVLILASEVSLSEGSEGRMEETAEGRPLRAI